MSKPILVVDDDPTIAQLASTILEMGGYEVVSANNAPQALEMAENDPSIDLVLSDVVMPGMSGVQLCDRLRRLRPRLKCIFMSGYDMGLLLNGEGNHFLPKPFYPNDLLEKVREVQALPAY